MSPQATLRLPKALDDVVELKGGLDQVTSTLKLHPGACRRALNFEAAINGGYTRIAGYERHDGRTSPSSATYRIVPLVQSNFQIGVGSILHGSSSNTSGVVLASVPLVPFGATRYLVMTNLSGPGFNEGEVLLSVGGNILAAIGPQDILLTNTLRKQYTNLAADYYRSFILSVPGVGPVRGAFGATFNGVFSVYAIRDGNPLAGEQNRAPMYRATPTGWVRIFGFVGSNLDAIEVNFVNGGPVPIEDNTPVASIPGLVVRRALLTGGSWDANTASGKIIYTSSDANQLGANSTFLIGETTITTLPFGAGGGVSTYEFAPGGAFEFVTGNFYGQVGTRRVYMCDGRNRAFEFDGTYVIPIDIGVATIGDDSRQLHPTHIAVHQNHLFVSVGSSVMNSGIGTPFNWSAGAGAAEYATGDTVTGFQILPGVQSSGALAVMSRDHTKILYGTAAAGPEPFNLVNFETETGAISGTIQKLDRVYYLDDRGVIDLKTAQDYGNFLSATLTRYIQRFIEQKHGRAVCSMINREKGQYRVFFNDGTALYLTFDNGKIRGAMPIGFPVPMSCAWSGEDNAGQEVGFLGGTDGFVYQLDRGTSFDGAAIDFELLLNWNSMRSPRQRKTIHRASIEIQDTDYTELRIGARLGPELTAHLQDDSIVLPTNNELAMQWDHFVWDDFWWDAHADAPLEVDVKGTAERVQYLIGGSSDYLDPFTLTSIVTHYIPRRSLR